nr:DUF397 domain-containing protein [Nocardiopsis mwathae]
MAWRTSTYSNNTGGQCVEVAGTRQGTFVRDTQNRHLGYLAVPAREWGAFLSGVRSDLL